MLTNAELLEIQNNNIYLVRQTVAINRLLFSSPPTKFHIREVYCVLKGFNKNIKLSDIPSFDTYSDLQKWKLGMITKILERTGK